LDPVPSTGPVQLLFVVVSGFRFFVEQLPDAPALLR